MLYQNEPNSEIVGIFFERYSALVFGVCLKYLKDRESAKDATQDIFKKLINDLKKYDIGNFRSWLYTISKNFCLMQLRKKDPLGERNNNEYFLANVMESSENWHPNTKDQDATEVENIEECLDALAEDQKECIKSFYYKKKSYAEIAKSAGIDLKKVKSLLQNGRRNLKICLEKKLKNV